MRGRTLANAFVILDEAQNTTPMQMKMFLTRLGEDSKMVVTGDPTQIDLPPGAKRAGRGGGHAHGVPGIEVIRFANATSSATLWWRGSSRPMGARIEPPPRAAPTTERLSGHADGPDQPDRGRKKERDGTGK